MIAIASDEEVAGSSGVQPPAQLDAPPVASPQLVAIHQKEGEAPAVDREEHSFWQMRAQFIFDRVGVAFLGKYAVPDFHDLFGLPSLRGDKQVGNFVGALNHDPKMFLKGREWGLPKQLH